MLAETTTKYFGKVTTEFKDGSWEKIEWPIGQEVEFTKGEYDFGKKTKTVGHGVHLVIDWKDVDFYKKEVTRTETVTKTYKL